MRIRFPAFSYALTRPYPYPWFTPVAILGAFALVAIFSVINYISNAYALSVYTTSNPNSTIADNQLFRKWPHYLTDRIQPSCDPVNVAVNSQISTNQSGLVYTITGVEQNGDVLPSLTYQNNLLETCRVNSILLDMDTQAHVPWSQGSQANWIIIVRAFISCEVALEAGMTRVNLTGVYNFVPGRGNSLPGLSSLIVQDRYKRTSLWWAESLLAYYSSQLDLHLTSIDREHVLSDEDLDDSGAMGSLDKAYIEYTPNDEDTHGIQDLSFFEIDFSFRQPSGSNSQVDAFVWWKGTQQLTDTNPVTTQVAVDHNAYPQIWDIADALAKSMYATVLTDLGQVNSTRANIVQQPEILQHYTANFTSYLNFWNASYGTGNTGLTKPGPASADFDASRAAKTVGPLGITPSVISTKYVCQVPQKRSSGSIALAIILADLVLLQAAWKLYTLLVGWLLVSRIPGANCCATFKGSTETGMGSKEDSGSGRQEESIELLSSPKASVAPLAGAYSRPGSGREDSNLALGPQRRPQSLG